MKNLKRILVFIVFMVAFYLIGAFVQVSFDITKWSEFARVCVGVFGFAISLMFAFIPFDNIFED